MLSDWGGVTSNRGESKKPPSHGVRCRRVRRLAGGWVFLALLAGMVPGRIALSTALDDEAPWTAVVQEDQGERSERPSVASTTDDGDAEMAVQVQSWVAQLDAPLRRQRDAAETALLEAGPTVLDLLPPAEDAPSAESRLRLGRVWQSLADAAVEQALRGSTLDLTGSGVAASEILAQIRRQSGNRLRWAVPDATAAPITGPLAGPFWPVLDGLLDAWNAELRAGGEPFTLQIVPRPPDLPARLQAAVYSGAFRLQPTKFRRFEEPDGTVTLRTGLIAEWEPKLWPVVVWQDAAWNRATTTSGKEVVSRSGGGRREIPLPRTVYPLSLTTDFTLPADDAAIARWTGCIEVLAAVSPYSFAFDLNNGLPRRRNLGDVTVELQRFETADDSAVAQLRIEYRNVAIPLKSHLAGVFENAARLEYPDGTQCEGVIRETPAETDRSAVVQYVFRLPETTPPSSLPNRLVTTIPLALRMVRVCYDFSGDRLPSAVGPVSHEDSNP